MKTLQEQISRMKSMMGVLKEETEQNNNSYTLYVDMGGVLFPSSGNDQVQAGTTERPTDVEGFQEWVMSRERSIVQDDISLFAFDHSRELPEQLQDRWIALMILQGQASVSVELS